MVNLDDGPEYPATVLERRDVTAKAVYGSSSLALPFVETHAELKGTARYVQNLSETLKNVVEELRKQVKLRHSLYYENPAIIEDVAEEIYRK